MTEIDTADPFLHLLTDALRAGPGSAQWEEAVARLRAGGVAGADEYELILRARADIESGRDYRAVRPGPGFTRKVLAGVEREGGRRPGIPTATLIAIGSALVIVGVLVTVIVMMSGGDPRTPEQSAVERLETTSFAAAGASADFMAATTTLPPTGWRSIGQLPLETEQGLKAGPATTVGEGGFVGGGLVTSDPLPADRAAAVEAEILLPATAGGAGSVQVFVSDSPEFSPDRATSPREVVWLYRDGRVTIDANGRSQGEGVNVAMPGEPLKVRISFERSVAVVESGGRRLYAGPHGLAPDKPRYVGVRFLRAAGESGGSATVRSVYVSQSAATGGTVAGR